MVETSTIQAIGKNKYGNVTKIELEEKLNSNAGEGKTEVIDDGENFVVKFIESNRYYKVDNDGNVEYFEVIVDEHPGNIKVGIKGEELTGTEERPFEIWCIEDLVEWSQNYTEYINSYIKLGRTLDFNSNLSYTDGKALSCSSIDELKESLTNTSGSGFTPIGDFRGNFNGQDFEIQNIYINVSEDAGLFATITNANISNIRISGNITSLDANAGGIVGNATNSNIIHCTNSANIVSMIKSAGGISGIKGKIIECYNYGEICSYGTNREYIDYNTGCAGGIVGSSCENIQNCGNHGNVISDISAGGIIGYKYHNFDIVNCYNTGKIDGKTYSGGIIGETLAGTCTIYNCYNTGKIESENLAGGIVAWIYYTTKLSLYNDCNIGEVSGDNGTGGIVGKTGTTGYYENNMPVFKNVYSYLSMIKAISNITVDSIILFDDNFSNVVNELNSSIESETELDTSNWKRWKCDNYNDIMFE